MKLLAGALIAGVMFSGAAFTQQSGALRPGDADPYATKPGAPNPYATTPGAQNPYVTRGGEPNSFSTQGSQRDSRRHARPDEGGRIVSNPNGGNLLPPERRLSPGGNSQRR